MRFRIGLEQDRFPRQPGKVRLMVCDGQTGEVWEVTLYARLGEGTVTRLLTATTDASDSEDKENLK